MRWRAPAAAASSGTRPSTPTPTTSARPVWRDAKRFEQRVAHDFLVGRYPEFELVEIFDVKACRVTVTKDAYGRVLDYVEFEKPHIVYTAAEIRLFKQKREDAGQILPTVDPREI